MGGSPDREGRAAPPPAPLPFGARVERFRGIYAPLIQAACYALSLAVLIGAWQGLGHSFGILFAPFTTTMARLWEMLHAGPLLPALGVSARLYLVTLAISVVLGVSVGLVFARVRLVSAALEPYAFILYAAPTISLVPFVQLVFGFTFWPQVLVAVVITIFPILIGTMQGARSLPSRYLDVAAMFGSSERQLWVDVILPFVVPFAMSGIRQALALAIAGTLVAEFFLNPDGLGAVFLQGTSIVDTTSVLAITVLVAMLAIVLVGLGELVEARLVRWRGSSQG